MDDMVFKRVLVVDDSTTMRMFLSFTLKKVLHGIAVTEAVHGADALEKLKRNDFDLVLSDMSMPVMDGAQLIGEIRGPLQIKVPIIVITTKGEEADRDRGLSMGANGYITKPVQFQELKEAVLRCLRIGTVIPV